MKKQKQSPSYNLIQRYARLLGFGEIHTKIDQKTGLNAIIAIHSTKLGPAIGGTRFKPYASYADALVDALQLAYGMTLKAAVSDLPHGGAKAVIIKPSQIPDYNAYFNIYGDFIHSLNGQYITAVDVGTTESEMDLIAERTPYVFGATTIHKEELNPSTYTAQGVFQGIKAAVFAKYQKNHLDGIQVAVQGAGHVGYFLIKLLTEAGARVSVSDSNILALDKCVQDFNAIPIPSEAIYDVPCDVFAPCALGQIINLANIARLKAKIIAGSANNQLAHRRFSLILKEKDILYAPDFVINAGGLIYAASVYDCRDSALANEKIKNIYNTLLNIFERSASLNKTTLEIAEQMARDKLHQTTN